MGRAEKIIGSREEAARDAAKLHKKPNSDGAAVSFGAVATANTVAKRTVERLE